MASVPSKELGFDEFVLGLTVQRGLSGERSYSFPPMMISSNLSGWPAMVVCIAKRDACWGLTTMIPSPVASNVTLPLTMCATSVKWPSLTFAVSGLARISCAVGGLAGPPALLLQPATTSAEIGSTSQACAFTALILAPACRFSDVGVVEGDAARGKARRSDDLLDDEDNVDQLSGPRPGLEPLDQPRPHPGQPLELLPQLGQSRFVAFGDGADAVEVQLLQLAKQMIRQSARLGQPGLPALLIAPIRLPDFPVRRSQRSNHFALPLNTWSRGSLVPLRASSLSIVKHRSQLIGQNTAVDGGNVQRVGVGQQVAGLCATRALLVASSRPPGLCSTSQQKLACSRRLGWDIVAAAESSIVTLTAASVPVSAANGRVRGGASTVPPTGVPPIGGLHLLASNLRGVATAWAPG